MKIYIMTDMEGTAGILDNSEWTMPGGTYYNDGKRLLTREVNAAVEGFYSAGAAEIYVFDGHGPGGIDQSMLDKNTLYIKATRPWPLLLDKSFDAVAWIGQHAKAGSEYAHIPHTQGFGYLDYIINGISVGEFGQLSMCAAYLGIHSIFCSGDNAFTNEAKKLVMGIEAVTVKWGLTPGSGDECSEEEYTKRNLSAIHLHPEKAHELIRMGAEKALKRFVEDKGSFSLVDMNPPFKKIVKHRKTEAREAYETCFEHPDDFFKMMNAIEK